MKIRTKCCVVLTLGIVGVASAAWAKGDASLREAIRAGNERFMAAAARGDGAAMASLNAESGQVLRPGDDFAFEVGCVLDVRSSPAGGGRGRAITPRPRF